eukprot:GHVQ01029364.1.p1 GENE.GHVQ01029364.1~~GHVQ01029364.1.p1  ORF type:complete len:177 (-),score=59.02 GHVQ01029364.1:617-1084(-)
MAAATIHPSAYSTILYHPPPTASGPDPSSLPHVRFDDRAYTRAFLLCTGAGHDHDYCSKRICQTVMNHELGGAGTDRREGRGGGWVMDNFQKECVDAIECMAVYGDERQCKHYMEGLYRLTNYRPPMPSMWQSLKHTWLHNSTKNNSRSNSNSSV